MNRALIVHARVTKLTKSFASNSQKYAIKLNKTNVSQLQSTQVIAFNYYYE